MARRKSGEGSWGKKIIKGVEYNFFKKSYNGKTKYFYGKTPKEIKAKIKAYEKTLGLVSDKSIRKTSFYDYAVEWLIEEKRDELSLKTYDNYEGFIERKIKETELGETLIGNLLSMENKEVDAIVKSYFDDIAKNYSSGMVNTGYTIINQVFEYAVLNDILSYNPMTRVKKPKAFKVSKNIIALNNSEIEALWQEMFRINTKDSIITGKEGTPVYGLPAYLTLFIAYTGLRYGEAAGIHREYIDREKKIAHIKTQVVFTKNRKNESDNANVWEEVLPKGGKTRIIPLADRAIQIIDMAEERYPNIKNGTLQFSNTGNPISPSNVNRVLKNMCKRANIDKDVTPHVLRHSFASILLNEDDKSLPVISEILGHSSVEVTYQVYIDIFMEKKMKTIELFNNIFNNTNDE